MTREDYIIRAIEQAAKAVARLMARLMHIKDAGAVEEALAQTRGEIGRLLGKDAALTEAFSVDELLAILKPIVAGDPARVGCLAVLLAVESALHDKRNGNGAGDEGRVKALALLLEARAVRGAFSMPEEETTFGELLTTVDPADLPVESQERLLSYYESTGNYTAAEDLLFDMCADEYLKARAAAWGREFFDRLLAKTDEELARGGLPREDVEEARRDVERLGG
jgi:hypothetical protein